MAAEHLGPWVPLSPDDAGRLFSDCGASWGAELLVDLAGDVGRGALMMGKVPARCPRREGVVSGASLCHAVTEVTGRVV